MTFGALVLPALLRGAELGRAGRVHRPVRRRVLGLARADEADRHAAAARSSTRSRSPSRCPASTGGAKLGLPDLLFFALFLGAAARFGLRDRLDVGLPDRLDRRRRWRSRRGGTWTACPRCRCSRSASCCRTPTCSGERSGIEAPEIPVELGRDPGVRRPPTATAIGLWPTGRSCERPSSSAGIDHRDRVVVDVRHPELAADPGRRERVRADVVTVASIAIEAGSTR